MMLTCLQKQRIICDHILEVVLDLGKDSDIKKWMDQYEELGVVSFFQLWWPDYESCICQEERDSIHLFCQFVWHHKDAGVPIIPDSWTSITRDDFLEWQEDPNFVANYDGNFILPPGFDHLKYEDHMIAAANIEEPTTSVPLPADPHKSCDAITPPPVICIHDQCDLEAEQMPSATHAKDPGTPQSTLDTVLLESSARYQALQNK